MTSDELRKRIKDGKPEGAWLFYGEEDYTKNACATMLRKTVLSAPMPEFNYSVYDGARLDIDTLAGDVNALPYMADRRMIEIKDFSVASLTAAASESLASVLADLPDYLILLFCNKSGEEEDKAIDKAEKKTFLQAVSEYGNAVKFESETGARLFGWMSRHFQAGGTPADRSVLETMVSVCGSDMYILSGEIDKLCAYCGTRPATSADVAKVCCANQNYKVFDLTRALIEGNIKKAGSVYANLVFNRAEPSMILGAIAKSFSDMLATAEGVRAGKTFKQIAADLKTYDFLIRRYASAASSRDPLFLQNAVRVCASADRRLKSFRGDPYTVLETAIYRIGACNAGKA